MCNDKTDKADVSRIGKADLVDLLASELDIPKKKAGEAVDFLLNKIVDTVAHGTEVRIPGFGVYKRVDRKERKARNLQTGETMLVPATKVSRRGA